MNKKKGKSVKCDLDYPKKLIVTRKVGSHAFNWMNSSQQFPFPWGYLSHGPPHTCCYHFRKLGPILDIKYAYFLFEFCFFPWEWGPRSCNCPHTQYQSKAGSTTQFITCAISHALCFRNIYHHMCLASFPFAM